MHSQYSSNAGWYSPAAGMFRVYLALRGVNFDPAALQIASCP